MKISQKIITNLKKGGVNFYLSVPCKLLANMIKILEKDNEDFKSYYKDINGWRKMNSLDNSNSVFSGKLPAPAFKITLTD